MTNSYHNNLKDKLDIYNLWKWPNELVLKYHDSTAVFVPDLNKWMSASDTGIIGGTNTAQLSFTSSSLTAQRISGYQAGVFLDLKPGKYIMTFDSSKECRIFQIHYTKITNSSNISFKQRYQASSFDNGSNTMNFTVPDGILVMLQFVSGNGAERIQSTFTNIRIIEGAE